MGLWRKGQSLNDWLTGRARGRREDDIITDPVPVRIIEHADGWGDWHATTNTSGKQLVLEDNSTQISGWTSANRNVNFLSKPASFAQYATAVGDVAALNGQHRIGQVPIVTDGAGDSVVTELVPTTAGYQPCMRLLYVWADGTDADWDVAFTASVGAVDIGPLGIDGLASVINTVAPDFSPGLYFHGDTDAAILQAQIANGGNVITYYFVFEYWYET